MKRIFIYAYLVGNLGDDLMVRILCKRYQDIQFGIYAEKNYRKRFQDVPNLKVYSWEDKRASFWNKFWKKIKGTDNGYWKMLLKFSDAVIHIGGSSFVQHYDEFMPLYDSDREIRRLSRKLFVIGVNFGPYTDDNYYRKYYELFEKYDGVTFRDHVSYELFKKLPNVRYAPDVVFNYDAEATENIRTKKQVLFSIIELENRGGKFPISQYKDGYESFILRMAEEAAERGYDIKFLSFCEAQGDVRAVQKIIERIPEQYRSRISSATYSGDVKTCIHLIRESEIIIGTRFHSIILGWLLRKKVLPVIYDDKTRHVLQDVDYRPGLELEELEGINACELFERLETMEVIPERKIKSLVKEAERQFWATDEFFDRT